MVMQWLRGYGHTSCYRFHSTFHLLEKRFTFLIHVMTSKNPTETSDTRFVHACSMKNRYPMFWFYYQRGQRDWLCENPTVYKRICPCDYVRIFGTVTLSCTNSSPFSAISQPACTTTIHLRSKCLPNESLETECKTRVSENIYFKTKRYWWLQMTR